MSEQSDVTRRWELASADTRRWRADADGLKAAADILRSHWLDTPGGQARIALPALLLAGYAVETFAKARILDLGNRPAFWTGHGHDLPWLVALGRC